MKKYAIIETYAQGYYSGSEHHEVVYLPYNIYEKIKDDMRNWFSAGELDGKHSDVEGSVFVEIVDEDAFKTKDVEFTDDEGYIYDLESMVCDNELDIDIHKVVGETRRYLDSLHEYVTMEISFKRESKEKVLQFLESLK